MEPWEIRLNLVSSCQKRTLKSNIMLFCFITIGIVQWDLGWVFNIVTFLYLIKSLFNFDVAALSSVLCCLACDWWWFFTAFYVNVLKVQWLERQHQFQKKRFLHREFLRNVVQYYDVVVHSQHSLDVVLTVSESRSQVTQQIIYIDCFIS